MCKIQFRPLKSLLLLNLHSIGKDKQYQSSHKQVILNVIAILKSIGVEVGFTERCPLNRALNEVMESVMKLSAREHASAGKAN